MHLIWVLSPRSRWRFAASIFLSAVLAFVEIVAFSAVVPLAQILTGATVSSSPVLQSAAEIFNTDDEQTLVVAICVAMLSLFLIKGFCGLGLRWWILGFIYREESDLADELISYYSRQDLEFHLAHRSSELLRNVNESVSHVFVFGMVGLVGFLAELTFTLCVAIVLVAVSPVAMGVFLCYVGITTWLILALIRPRARAAGRQMADSSALLYRLGGDVLKGYRDVHLRNAGPYMVSKYMKVRHQSTEAHRRAGFLSESPRYMLEMVFVTGIALFAGALYVTIGLDEAFPLLAFVVIIGFRLMPTLSRMLSFASLVRIGLPSLDMVEADLRAARMPITPAGEEDEGPLQLERGIDITDVHYRYPGAPEEAVRGVSITLPVGTSTALVGRSGSGKSTLADLVCGLLRPGIGTIEVDGVDIATVGRRWNASLGVVSQTTYVLDGTIAENVAFGIPGEMIDYDRVRRALEQAGISDYVSSLPLGERTSIGEDGSALSGGQRQRIGLARALYARPRLLVLDEATSALDSKTESEITETLESLKSQVTVLVIAHRLSTVQSSDQVAYMDDGNLMHVGTFNEVVQALPDFAEMVRLGTVDGSEPVESDRQGSPTRLL